jgi:hypothetical protein
LCSVTAAVQQCDSSVKAMVMVMVMVMVLHLHSAPSSISPLCWP